MQRLYPYIRPILFQMDAEKSHHMALKSMHYVYHSPLRCLLKQPLIQDPVKLWGLTFPNRLGLAAGLDKNGDYIEVLHALGFGFIEIGTVTPKPQTGNEQPRLFRLPKSRAIINRMGFNNKGVDYLTDKVSTLTSRGLIGINIGKNKTTPEDKAVEDYLIGLNKVYPFADYITINISSPNTPGLRNLQFGEHLEQLLSALKSEQKQLETHHQCYKPILIKVAPDLSTEEIKELADTFLKHQVDGIIATNTTNSRDTIPTETLAQETGGLSGEPLTKLSLTVIESFKKHLGDSIPIIGVGGIHDAQSALDKMNAGASLIQIYTGFIYQGPQLIQDINSFLKDHNAQQLTTNNNL